jgi:hypothetical protein
MFKDAVRRRGVESSWFAFRAAALKQIANRPVPSQANHMGVSIASVAVGLTSEQLELCRLCEWVLRFLIFPTDGDAGRVTRLSAR